MRTDRLGIEMVAKHADDAWTLAIATVVIVLIWLSIVLGLWGPLARKTLKG